MMCALTMPTKEPDKRLSARKHAKRVYLISDIHGTLEVLLQFLQKSDSLSINTNVGFLAQTGELIQQMESKYTFRIKQNLYNSA